MAFFTGSMCSHRSYTMVNHRAFKTYPKISNSDFLSQFLISKTSNRKKNNYFFLFEVLVKLPYTALVVASLVGFEKANKRKTPLRSACNSLKLEYNMPCLFKVIIYCFNNFLTKGQHKLDTPI